MLGLRLLALLVPDDPELFRPVRPRLSRGRLAGRGPKPGGADKRSGV